MNRDQILAKLREAHDTAQGRGDQGAFDVWNVVAEIVDAHEQEEILRVVQITERTPLGEKVELLDRAADRGNGVKVTVRMDTFDDDRELLGVIHRQGDRYRIGGRASGTVFRVNHVKRMELI